MKHVAFVFLFSVLFSATAGGAGLLGSLGGLLTDFGDRVHDRFGVDIQHQQIRLGFLRRRNVVTIEPDDGRTQSTVLMLHYGGRIGTAEGMANLADASRLSRKHNARVVLPEAGDGKWNAGNRRWWQTDDVAYLDRVLNQLDESADPETTYVAGMSSGGYMAAEYACQRPERVGGLGMVAATVEKATMAGCDDPDAMPTLLILGRDDALNPYQGNSRVTSARQSLSFFATNNTCLGSTAESALANPVNDGTRAEKIQAKGCPGHAPASLIRIQGGGHTWPDDTALDQSILLGPVSRDFSATNKLMFFFTR